MYTKNYPKGAFHETAGNAISNLPARSLGCFHILTTSDALTHNMPIVLNGVRRTDPLEANKEPPGTEMFDRRRPLALRRRRPVTLVQGAVT